jgi:hypothetical protein
MNTPEPKEFTAVERNYWRHRALRAEEKLRDIATECGLPPTYPPQPPIHTHIEDEEGNVWWYRMENGWHCSNPTCTHCPTTWDHVISYNTDAHTYVFNDPHDPHPPTKPAEETT